MKNTDQDPGSGQRAVGKSKCLLCSKEVRRYKGKFCSRSCYWKNKVGEKHWWGDRISKALSGKAKSKEHVEKVRKALTGKLRPDISGSLNIHWKGDGVGYAALHDWVRSKLGTPKECAKCLSSKNDVMYQWANVSGLYKRDLKDWQRLCIKCHRKNDKNEKRASLIFEKRNKQYTLRKL